MRKLLCLALIASAGAAHATEWLTDPLQSKLTFEGTQSGDAFKGEFKSFTSDIEFSEATPEKGRIHVTVDMKSATVEGKDRNDALPTKSWFSVVEFPKAEFTSSAIHKVAEHQFIAQGKLTIRGISQDVALPFTLTPENGKMRATGSLTLKRNEYKIGDGEWASDKWIAYPVKVSYEIFATAK